MTKEKIVEILNKELGKHESVRYDSYKRIVDLCTRVTGRRPTVAVDCVRQVRQYCGSQKEVVSKVGTELIHDPVGRIEDYYNVYKRQCGACDAIEAALEAIAREEE